MHTERTLVGLPRRVLEHDYALSLCATLLVFPVVRARGALNGHLARRSERENNRQRRREICGPPQREEPP